MHGANDSLLNIGFDDVRTIDFDAEYDKILIEEKPAYAQLGIRHSIHSSVRGDCRLPAHQKVLSLTLSPPRKCGP